MSGDYSRQRFDPRAHFAGVLMQQGRVQLDADWNELVELLDRRLRAETVDLVSRGADPDIAGVAAVPRQTPDAFRIEAASGKITIGRGRMYVDGLLAENHGAGTDEFDALLVETRGKNAVPYDSQPYLPHPPALPRRGPHLAYLDVWQREITHLERPCLVEPAVGVDTTTRLQMVWQVRVLADVGAGVTCLTPDAHVRGWLDLISPSSGRLSTKAIGVKPSHDPCELPPTGGYRGLENQLYRVEIHDGGGVGQATFKWSRDNASVASRVAEVVSSHELRLESFGRDAVLSFGTGDWVEIIDEWRELTGEQGDPGRRHGEIRKITVDVARQTITFSPDLPADLVPSGTGSNTLETRRLRVRRWDQQGKVRDASGNEYFDLDGGVSKGVIPAPAANTPLVLEKGVQVTFSLEAGGEFRCGDYWVFAARTADASVETLTEAPPRGTHHHFARLAVVSFPDSESDCRMLWPPQIEGKGCDCTVCVTAESHASGALTIQKAVDQVKATGGTICLGAGAYQLGEAPVQLEGAQSVRLRGQGWRTMLVAPGPAIEARGCAGLAVENLSIVSVGAGSDPVVSMANSLGVRLEGLTMLVYGTADANAPAIGLSGTLFSVDIRDNTIVSPVGIARSPARGSKIPYLATMALRIEDNALWSLRRGVSLDGVCLHLAETRVRGNNVLGCTQAGVTLTGATVPGSGIDVSANTLLVSGDGVVGAADGLRVEGNEVTRFGESAGGDGIVLAPGLDATGMDRCQVLANRIVGVGGTGIAVRTLVRSAMIKDNVIEGAAGGIVFEDRGSADHVAIENNQVIAIAPDSNDAIAAPVGIRIVATRKADVSGNAIRGVGINAVQPQWRAGIQAVACAALRIAANEITDIGPAGEFLGSALGIEVVRPFDRADIADNMVRREETPERAETKATWLALSVHAPAEMSVRRTAARVATIRLDDGSHLVVTGSWAFAVAAGSEAAGIHGNRLEGRGRSSLVRVVVLGDCAFDDNRCLQLMPSDEPIVLAGGMTMIAHGNRVLGGPRPLVLQADPKRLAVVGNITSGSILVGNSPLPGPWDALNVVA